MSKAQEPHLRKFPHTPFLLGNTIDAAHEAHLTQLVEEINARPDFPLTTDERRSLNDRGETAGSLDLGQIAEIEFCDSILSIRSRT